MLCKNPYMMGALPFACGQCIPCRINRRRLWTHRILLESYMHEASSFLTLTYNEENYPEGGSLVPKHTQDWLKRFRFEIYPKKVRYYLVGEYGDETQRPHYHAALFGVGLEYSKQVAATWSRGHIMLGDLNKDSASYIAGYVTKKMTKSDDPRLKGRHPEFARMSLRPGIGADAVKVIARDMVRPDGQVLGLVNGDVPTILQHGQKKMPLGRYLRSKLKLELNYDNSEENLHRYSQEMSLLFQTALDDKENSNKSFKKILLDENAGKRALAESRYNIYNKKGTL